MGHNRRDLPRAQAAPRLVRRRQPRGNRLADQVGGRARHHQLLRRLVLEQGLPPPRALAQGILPREIPRVPEVVHDVREPQPAGVALDRGPDRRHQVLDRQLLQDPRILHHRRQARGLHLGRREARPRLHRRGGRQGRAAEARRRHQARVCHQRADGSRGRAPRHLLDRHVADEEIRLRLREAPRRAGLPRRHPLRHRAFLAGSFA